MKKHGFYLSDGNVKKFRYGQAVCCRISETQMELIKRIPQSFIHISKTKPISFKIHNGEIYFSKSDELTNTLLV
jgi:hypothetical protein